MKTAQGLVQWAEEAYAKGWVYWYGTCGYDCTAGLLERKTKQYPDQYGDNRQPKYKKHIKQGKVCSDCIGLFKSYAWDEDGDIDTRESDYGSNGQPDNGAKTTLSKCKVKGSISAMPEIPGLAVWTATGGHIGVYVGGGYVVEARGYSYGVQRNRLADRAFTTWGLYPFVKYTPEQDALAEAAANGVKTPAGAPAEKVDQEPVQSGGATQAAKIAKESGVYDMGTMRKGDRGMRVRVLQWLLNYYGYACGVIDGIYGDKTKRAVEEYQRANGLEADGIAGPKTLGKMLPA